MNIIINPIQNEDYYDNYRDKVEEGIEISIIREHIPTHLYNEIQETCHKGKIRFWGVSAGDDGKKKSMWMKIKPGDIALFAKNQEIISSAVVTAKHNNLEFAKQFLKLKKDISYIFPIKIIYEYGEYAFFLDELKIQSIRAYDFSKVAGYSFGFAFRNFFIPKDQIKSQNLINYYNLASDIYLPYVSEKDYALAISNYDSKKMLDIDAKFKRRLEQNFLRKHLFNNKKYSTCALCGKKYGVEFLVAGHIKRRSMCTIKEKLDYKSIVMPICKFGCDELYEKGYISVLGGKVILLKSDGLTDNVLKYLNGLVGRECAFWNQQTIAYFKWHYNYHKLI